MSLLERGSPPEKTRDVIQATKIMATIPWNRHEFQIVDILSKGKTLNVTDYIEHILPLILALRPKSGRRRFVIHSDNARP
jgi:hypothetical protein